MPLGVHLHGDAIPLGVHLHACPPRSHPPRLTAKQHNRQGPVCAVSKPHYPYDNSYCAKLTEAPSQRTQRNFLNTTLLAAGSSRRTRKGS